MKNYEELEDKLSKSNEIVKTQKETIKRIEIEQTQLNADLNGSLNQLKTLDVEKQQLDNEKCTLIKDMKQLQLISDASASQVSQLKSMIKELEDSFTQSSHNEMELRETNQNLVNEIQALESRVAESENLLETYQSYRETCDDQALTIEQLTLELEWMRESNQKLTARLSVLEPDTTAEPDAGGKTLLTEIEDRRQEIIRAHEALTQKHAGLADAHKVSQYRQQKMKHHIARLSQLSGGNDNSEKLRMLEEALAQCESEKAELEARLDQYQRDSHCWTDRDDDENDDEDARIPGDSERISILEFRIEQIIEECEGLKQANKTLRLVKAGETDKLHHVTSLLHERERELELTKRNLSSVKYEFDEFKLAVEHDLKSTAEVQSSTTDQLLVENTEKNDCNELESVEAEEKENLQLKVKIPVARNSILVENNQNLSNNLDEKFVDKQQVKTLDGMVGTEKSDGKRSPGSLNSLKPKTITVDRAKIQQQDCKQQ